MATLVETPFKVAVPDETIAALKAQVKATPVPRPTFEASDAAAGKHGLKRDWLQDVKAFWEDGFDWRAQEERINTFAQFTTDVVRPDRSKFKLHYIHERSSNPKAKNILLLHGWPGSFLEFLDVIKILKSTGDYNLVAPSHPGYLFSDPPPLDKEFGKKDVAEIEDALMRGLGYNQYIVQAGDWGISIARILGVKYPSCTAVHLNAFMVPSPDGFDESTLSEREKKGVERGKDFVSSGRGYAIMHQTRPATIGLVLGSNPVALLSWIGEKFLEWSDTDPSYDEILTSLTLWYVTDTFPTSIYPYRDRDATGTGPEWYIHKPTGFSSFPKEIVPTPRAWAATTANLVFYSEHEKGGHFAALEQPELLAKDIVDFVAQLSDSHSRSGVL